MNFTVTPEARRKHYLLLISVLLAVDIAIIVMFNFNLRESALLLIATPSLLNLFLKFVMPLMQKKAKEIKEEVQEELMDDDKKKAHQILIAKREGRKPFQVGPQKQHTVYAKNFIDANKFYNSNIDHIAKKKPNKKYFYVTKKYNNL